MLDNFKTIEQFMQFQKGTFYKFECLVRNTDGENILYEEGFSRTNKNILVKSWYVDNQEYYEKIKPEMIKMCNLTGARLYITLDRKTNLKLVQELIHALTDTLCDMIQGKEVGIKSLSKLFASKTSVKETSDKSTKTLMWDVDTKEENVLEAVKQYIKEQGQEPYVLNTKKGYHVISYRKYNHADWLQRVIQLYNGFVESSNKDVLNFVLNDPHQVLSVKDNELGLVYHPTAEEA